MSIRVNLKFDGKVFIPQGPVMVPVNEVVSAELTFAEAPAKPESWQVILERMQKRAVPAGLPDSSLDRGEMYSDRV